MEDEQGVAKLMTDLLRTELRGDKLSFIARGKDYTKMVFVGNRLKFDGQQYPYLFYTVTTVTLTAAGGSGDTIFFIDKQLVLSSGVSTTAIKAYRYYGGRGVVTLSRIACSEKVRAIPIRACCYGLISSPPTHHPLTTHSPPTHSLAHHSLTYLRTLPPTHHPLTCIPHQLSTHPQPPPLTHSPYEHNTVLTYHRINISLYHRINISLY